MKSSFCSEILIVALILSAGETSSLAQGVAPGASATKVQAILQVDLGGNTGFAFLDKSPSSKQLQTFINNQAALIKSQFVIKAALAPRDIAGLDLVQSQHNKDAWLLKSLDIQNPPGTSLVVLTLQSSGDEDELRTVLDSVVRAYQNEVVAAEMISNAENHRAAEAHAKVQEAELRQLLERRLALANELKGQSKDSVELSLLDLQIGVCQKIIEEIKRALILQRMRDELRTQEVKVLQSAIEVPSQ